LAVNGKKHFQIQFHFVISNVRVMGKLLISFLLISTLTIACTSQTNEKVLNDEQQTRANVETKTNTSSSSAKANDQGDSSVIIRPVRKYKHQKKFKIK